MKKKGFLVSLISDKGLKQNTLKDTRPSFPPLTDATSIALRVEILIQLPFSSIREIVVLGFFLNSQLVSFFENPRCVTHSGMFTYT